ncbi:PBS lyase HEAT domain protein repeat-containing protein, partial [Reticulomyxa filosa]
MLLSNVTNNILKNTMRLKLNEQQLDDVIEFFMDGLVDKNKYIHERCAFSIAKIALKLNEKQLNKVFECLMNAFESGRITISYFSAHALATISSQLGGKQFDNAFQCFIHRFPSYVYILHNDATQFIMKLKEEQLGDVFKYLVDRLSDEKEDDNARIKCAELLGKISMKWNEKQLIDAFNSLIDIFNDIDASYSAFQYVCEAIAAITVKFPGRQFDNTFNYLISRLNCEGIAEHDKYADLIERITQRVDEKQINIALNCFMGNLNKHQNIRIKCIQLIKEISNKCNEQQLNKAFNSSMDIFTDKNDADVRKKCTELLVTIAVNLNGKHFDNAFQCFTNGLKDSNSSIRYSCAKSLVTLSKKWNDKQLDIIFQCLVDGFQKINGYCWHISCYLLEGIAMELNETQIDSVFTCLINGLKDKDEKNRKLCAKSIGFLLMKLNKKQLNDVFECLNGLKGENECIRTLCRKSLETIPTKLNDKQLDRIFNAFIHGLKDKYCRVHEPCAEPLGIIATKANEKQLKKVFNVLMSGLKDEDVCKSCANAIGKILDKLDEKQLENIINTLIGRLKDKESLEIILTNLTDKLEKMFNIFISGLKDENYSVRELCARSLGVISANLTDKQLERIFNALSCEQKWHYFNSCEKALEEISTKWNEKHPERIFNALIFVSKHSMNTNNNTDKDILLVALLRRISAKLNDKKLYLLVIHLLERAKKRCAWDALSKISDDIWKRATICGLKKNIQMKNENTLMNKENSHNHIWKTANDTDIQLLAFGLMTFNPCIQLSCDDNNTNFDALNELIRYCDEQAIEWNFPTHQWTNDNDYNDIPYPCLDNEVEEVPDDENEYKGCYTVVHEAARSGNLSQFKLVLQNHPDIDINDSYNKHGQTPLHLAINNRHWDIARYCIEQGAYIDIREGAVNSLALRTPFENIMKFIMKHKKEKNTKEYLNATEMCKWILKQRTMYPMKRIEYAIDYVKDKLIDKDGVIKIIDEESATFLLGVGQKQLKEILIKNNLLYWAAGRNVISMN